MSQTVRFIGGWDVNRFPKEGVDVAHKARIQIDNLTIWVFDVEEKA